MLLKNKYSHYLYLWCGYQYFELYNPYKHKCLHKKRNLLKPFARGLFHSGNILKNFNLCFQHMNLIKTIWHILPGFSTTLRISFGGTFAQNTPHITTHQRSNIIFSVRSWLSANFRRFFGGILTITRRFFFANSPCEKWRTACVRSVWKQPTLVGEFKF